MNIHCNHSSFSKDGQSPVLDSYPHRRPGLHQLAVDVPSRRTGDLDVDDRYDLNHRTIVLPQPEQRHAQEEQQIPHRVDFLHASGERAKREARVKESGRAKSEHTSVEINTHTRYAEPSPRCTR